MRSCLYPILSLLSLAVLSLPALADDGKALELERKVLPVIKDLCGTDLGCRYLTEDYENEDEREGQRIIFSAMALYVQQTLAPKLPQDEPTKKKIEEVTKAFEQHLAITP